MICNRTTKGIDKLASTHLANTTLLRTEWTTAGWAYERPSYTWSNL